jgi:hypothetical protein
MQKSIFDIFNKRQTMLTEMEALRRDIAVLNRKNMIAKMFFLVFIIKRYKKEIDIKQSQLVNLSEELNNVIYHLDIKDNSIIKAFKEVQKSYSGLCNSRKIWDKASRSPVDNSGRSTIKFIQCVETPMYFKDTNNIDFYIYPNAAIAFDKNENAIGAFTINELQVRLLSFEQTENGDYPSDSEVVRCTWRFPRQDGGPDLRYRNNYKISVVRYGEIHLSFSTYPLTFYISNFNNGVAFEKAFNKFVALANSQLPTITESVCKTPESTVKEHPEIPETLDVEENTNKFKNKNIKSSVQRKMLSAKKLYQYCSSFEDILDLYITNTPLEERSNAIQLEVLRWYIVFKRRFFNNDNLSTRDLEHYIKKRLEGVADDSLRILSSVEIPMVSASNESESQITHKIKGYRESYSEFLRRFASNFKAFQNIEELLKCYISQVPRDQLLSPKNMMFLKKYLFETRTIQEDLSIQEIKELLLKLFNTSVARQRKVFYAQLNNVLTCNIRRLIAALNNRIHDLPSISVSGYVDLEIENNFYNTANSGSDSTEVQQQATDVKKSDQQRLIASLNMQIVNMTSNSSNLTIPERDYSESIETFYQTNDTQESETHSKKINLTTEKLHDFTVAEFELDEEKSEVKAISIPLIPGDNLPNIAYEKMKEIPNKLSKRGYVTSQRIFYEQAKFMENHTDTTDFTVDFMAYFPTYEDMSIMQLQWYFSWRTNVRKGNYVKTSLSYIYVYAYELINKIGVKNSEDGFNKLVDLWKAYRGEYGHLDRYLPEWIRDYNIVYECNRKYGVIINEFIKNGVHSYWIERETLVNMILTQDLNNSYDFLARFSNYKFKQSKFYKSEYGHLLTSLIGLVLIELDKNGSKPLIEILFGEIKPERWYPFRSTPFHTEKFTKKQEYFITDTIRIWVDKGDWYSTYPQKISVIASKYIGDVIKSTESYLRDQIQFKNKLRIENISQSIKQVSKDIVERYCRENNLSYFSTLKNSHDDSTQPIQSEKIATELTFNAGILEQLRQESAIIQEKLTIDKCALLDSEEKVPTEPFEEVMDDSRTLVTTETSENRNEWELLFDNLPEFGLEVLSMLIQKEDVNTKLVQISQKQYILLEVMLEAINEKALDYLGDNM